MTMNRRRFMFLAVALVALNTFFWVAQGGFAIPKALIQTFFGSRMVRAEVVYLNPDGTTGDERIDRGVIMAVTPALITLQRRTERPSRSRSRRPRRCRAAGSTAPLGCAAACGWSSTTRRTAADSVQVEGVGG